jgi:hypothetical protein
MPNIKVKEVTRIKIQNKYPAVEVTGTKLNDGKDYSTKVFLNQEDLAKKLEALNPGDEVNLWMKQEGKYWNLQDVLPIEDNKSSGKSNKGGNSGGNSRGDDTNKASAIYLAKDIVLAAYSAAELKKLGPSGIIALTRTAADDVYAYITGETVDEDLTPPADLNPNADDDDLPDPPDDI